LPPLNDPKTVEIMLNADGKLWQERLGERMKCIGTLRVAQAQAIIETIAGYHGKEVTKNKPILEGEFPLTARASPASSPRLCPAHLRHSEEGRRHLHARAVRRSAES
jgi:Flp pilus assembly CpaF family ATPase